MAKEQAEAVDTLRSTLDMLLSSSENSGAESMDGYLQQVAKNEAHSARKEMAKVHRDFSSLRKNGVSLADTLGRMFPEDQSGSPGLEYTTHHIECCTPKTHDNDDNVDEDESWAVIVAGDEGDRSPYLFNLEKVF